MEAIVLATRRGPGAQDGAPAPESTAIVVTQELDPDRRSPQVPPDQEHGPL